MRRLGHHRRLGHSGRTILAVVVLLVVGAGLGLGGLKAAHKIHLTTTSSVAQASAGYDLDAPTAAAVEGPDLFVANEAGNSVSVRWRNAPSVTAFTAPRRRSYGARTG